MRRSHRFGDYACGNSDRFMFHEQPKDHEPGWLGECSQRRYCVRLRQVLPRTNARRVTCDREQPWLLWASVC